MRVGPRSTRASVGRGTRSRKRPSVRCGRNGRASGAKPASRAARSHARCSSWTLRRQLDAQPQHARARRARGTCPGPRPGPRRRTRVGRGREPGRERLELRLRARAEEAQRQVHAVAAAPGAGPASAFTRVLQRSRSRRAAARRARARRRRGCAASAGSKRRQAEEAAPQHLERGLRRLLAHALAVARKQARRTRVPAAPAIAMKTRPTGFSGVPPSGPAMPVIAARDVGAGRAPRAGRHRARHLLGDGAVAAMSVSRVTPSARTFAWLRR